MIHIINCTYTTNVRAVVIENKSLLLMCSIYMFVFQSFGDDAGVISFRPAGLSGHVFASYSLLASPPQTATGFSVCRGH